MRLHTDRLVESDVHAATAFLPGVYATVSTHGSRSHERALEFFLTGNGYAKNTGTSGADWENGATWDEWGVVLQYLFDRDPEALAGSQKNPVYNGAADYHQKTMYRFESGELPADTHKRHAWEYLSPRYFGCKKCSAKRFNG